MIAEKTIQICGNDVRLRYCAATETGYESLSGKNVNVFTSTPTEFDKDGKPTKFDPPVATTQDYLTLAVAAIVAAYARNEEEPPVKSEDILYDATPQEVSNLLTTVVMLRVEWYKVPEVVNTDMKPDAEGSQPKNPPAPTTSSRK
jgi:hypothetical protein